MSSNQPGQQVASRERFDLAAFSGVFYKSDFPAIPHSHDTYKNATKPNHSCLFIKKDPTMDIRLRQTLDSDLDFVLNAERSDENSNFVIMWTYEQHKQALSSKDLLHLIVERCDDNKPIGYLILAGLQQTHQSIEFRRIVITDKGKGYGRKTLQLVRKMAFEELSAHRLWLDVKEHNLRARHVYEAEGFIVEGVLRECLKTGDKFESLVILSMLKSEYQTHQNS